MYISQKNKLSYLEDLNTNFLELKLVYYSIEIYQASMKVT
jgi:hypothetical protein